MPAIPAYSPLNTPLKMNLFSQEDILKIEQITLAELGLSKMQFIDTIGLEIADEIGAEHDSRTPVIIFAGPDDCGAYALAAATALQYPIPYVYGLTPGELAESPPGANRH